MLLLARAARPLQRRAAAPAGRAASWPALPPPHCRCAGPAAAAAQAIGGPRRPASTDASGEPGQPRLTRAERRRLQRQRQKAGGADDDDSAGPAVSQSSAREAAMRLWAKEPLLFESSRAGLVRVLSALSVVQASAWTWFAATSYGPMAPPEFLMEGSWQMSYWLMSTCLTISYGFFGGSYIYSTSYVCRLKIPDRACRAPVGRPVAHAPPCARVWVRYTNCSLRCRGGFVCVCAASKVEVTTHTFIGGERTAEYGLSDIECT